MKKTAVLGAGLVGKAIAIDLHKNFDVTAFDIDEKALRFLKEKHNIKTVKTDLCKENETEKAVSGFDLVVNAVPGFMGYNILKRIIEAGKDVVDISFFPENPFELNELAKNKNVIAVTDCGVAPGMGNIICGYHNSKMKIENYKCFVGGLPAVREYPFNYKAVFSPIDVIEEYTRPARYIQNGKLIIREALSDIEFLNFDEIGTLEAFNTDGLRSLMQTMKIPNMIEKTMRFPGTADNMRFVRECGFFSQAEIEVNGNKIKPIDLTAKLFFPKWKLKENETEFTVMRIIIEGTENNKPAKYIYNLYDKYNAETQTSSMARTTGYTCTAAVNLIAEGKYKKTGISPPEYLGYDEDNFNFIVNYLKNRNVIYKREKIC